MHHSMSMSSCLLFVYMLASSTSAFVPTESQHFTGRFSMKLRSSSDVIDLRDDNFRDYFSSETPILIDACAEWCGPCKLIEPVLDKCATDRKETLVVSRYDVESDSNEIKLELLLQRVMPQALPSLILIQKNKVLGTRNGLITADELDEFLDSSIELASVTGTQDVQQENEEKARRIKRKGFISFIYQQDDYMLKGDHL